MSANFFTGILHHEPRPTDSFRPERRKRKRTSVRWRLTLVTQGAAASIETATRNLSSGGFYCLSQQPLTPGETALCALRVPAHDPETDARALLIECRVVVMRCEPAGDNLFGIACRIDDYRLLPEPE